MTRRRSRLAGLLRRCCDCFGDDGRPAADPPGTAEHGRCLCPRLGRGSDRWLAGSLLWFAVPVVAATGVLVLGWLEPWAARRRREQLIMEVPQALELMAACLGAGLPARTACAAVVRTFDGPVADDLGQVLALLELGVGDVVAWKALHDHPQLGLAAADLARSVESGTSMVQGLRHHAPAARHIRRSELQVLARAVGVRTIRF